MNVALFLFLISHPTFAGKIADKPKFMPGQKVMVASCKDGAYEWKSCNDYVAQEKAFREKKPWTDCAYTECLRVAGKIVVVQYARNSCAPALLKIDSCDDYEYDVFYNKKEHYFVREHLLMKIK